MLALRVELWLRKSKMQKETRSTVENASSIASLVLTTEALIAEEPEPEPPMPPGGMGGMEGMM